MSGTFTTTIQIQSELYLPEEKIGQIEQAIEHIGEPEMVKAQAIANNNQENKLNTSASPWLEIVDHNGEMHSFPAHSIAYVTDKDVEQPVLQTKIIFHDFTYIIAQVEMPVLMNLLPFKVLRP